ncbi:hypothetical protein BU25DRAFT_415548 [Macroventuria anomochaeta]|uniref:Uncharacterized protein n=1 Tax=Macroventuria anomochaeta TaxID=301207 RepID=A0ACB6RLI8_9PLEO|nr:uncharacterized protein BU25DRAFT_415548 [Macroventuria anomochaeta]KAF2622019.1 hypothetical protein BU25DRAFT_415548 [Macroventuria anomochaeta]
MDKLPAVAGLARRFDELSPIPNNEYLAGLWKHTLRYDLWVHDSVRDYGCLNDVDRS